MFSPFPFPCRLNGAGPPFVGPHSDRLNIADVLFYDVCCPLSQTFTCQRHKMSCRLFGIKMDGCINPFFLSGIHVIDLV